MLALSSYYNSSIRFLRRANRPGRTDFTRELNWNLEELASNSSVYISPPSIIIPPKFMPKQQAIPR